jgi:DNA repair protein SbcD/Mre11
MAYQLLHFSDLHLDASFAADGIASSVGDWRRSDLRATAGRILALARERRVDAITIGGDLYEQEYALPDTGEFLAQQFARLAPIHVFLAPGERDPYTLRSLYALTDWPPNVHIFAQGQLVPLELAPHVHLWGAAHPAAEDNRAVERIRADRSGINILLLHASESSGTKSGNEAHFIVDAEAVRNVGFDFALLGHRHTARAWPNEAPYCVYPGSPEPLCWDEAGGGHGVVLLTIDEGRVRFEQIPISQWRYWATEIELTDCHSPEEALKRIYRSLSTAPGGPNERLICRVTLTGSPGFDLDLSVLASGLETKAHVQLKARVALGRDLEQLAAEQTVRGLLVRRFQARLAGARDPEERQAILKALALALDVLEGRQVRSYEVA